MNESEEGAGTQANVEDNFYSKNSELQWVYVEDEAEVDPAGVVRKCDTFRDT